MCHPSGVSMSVLTPPPPPEAIASGILATWFNHLEEMAQHLQAVFPFRKTHRRAVAYVEGLFNTVSRKNSWQLTEVCREANPYSFQHLLDRAAWSPDAVRDALQAYRVIPLLLCMCLGWLWGAVPVAAQNEAPSPAAEVSGPYQNLAENHAGSFHLRQDDGVVFATFRTDRSLVQFLARDRSEVLFTVPKGFRPAEDITWDISAQPVQADGTPHLDQSNRQVFRMRVDTEGRVRYVDDPGVDGASYLRYRTTLAWPLAGTEPRLCERHWKIRDGILKAMQALDDASLPCSQVEWTHLARIRILSLSLPGPLDADAEWHSLLGLTNLTTLQVSASEVNIPAELLVHTPRLEWLEVASRGSLALPADLFRHTPLLTYLSLANNPHLQGLDLPGDLLAHVPHLDTLQLAGQLASPRLKVALPAEQVQQLLAHVPHLTRLNVATTTPLSERFLTAVPHLTHLTVEDGLEPCATPQLLAPVPHLRHVAVRIPADAEALDCLADSLHRHTPALAQLEVELQDLQGLNAESLPSLPRLARLTLDVTGMTSLPEPLLAQVPELTHLTLKGGNVTLPAGFLAHTPRLTALSLRGYRLNDLPSDLLAPVPGLRQLQIDTSSSISLPAGFLDPVPQLSELRMEVDNRANLPADFLMHAPYLEVLHLNVQSQESLPANFLTYAPRLVDLYLRMPVLQALPPTFLIHAPRLETLELEAGHGILGNPGKCNQNPPGPRQFPEHFLSHAPSLVELYLRVPMLQDLPPSFLGHAPLLETMTLAYDSGYCLGYGPDLLKVVMSLRSLPANFLTHAPNLRHLNLQTGYIAEFSPDFLSHAPLLRHLVLDANGISALPTDFLTRHPRLETVRLLANGIPSLPHGFLSQSPNLVSLTLDLRQVEALPERFLANTPHLHEVEIDVHRAKTLPPDFLAHAPHLTFLNLRARSLTAWPPNLLAHAPRIHTLGLVMPLLEPTLTPDHRLWSTLRNTSMRVKVFRPDPFYFEDSDISWGCTGPSVRPGSILEIEGREQDNNGHTLLRVRNWQDREFFAFDLRRVCPFLIDARFTTPTLEVCEAFREPEACEPIRNRYTTLSGDGKG